MPAPASVLGRGAREPRFPGAGFTADEQAVAGFASVTERKTRESARIEILNGRLRIPEARLLEQPGTTVTVTSAGLSADQQ